MAKRKKDITNPALSGLLDSLAVNLAREFGDSIVFKGGFITLKRFPDKGRTTTDVDIDLLKKDIYPEVIRIATAWAEDAISRGIATSYNEKPPQPNRCGRFALLNEKTTVCSIDINPDGENRETVLFEVGGLKVIATTVEQMLVDKLSAFCSRSRFRRFKDIYDIWLVTESMKINLRTMYRIIQETKPLVIEDPHPFSEESIEMLRRGYSALIINDPMSDKGREVVKPPYEVVLERVAKLVEALAGVPWLDEDDDGMW